jgi:hypothetical protein
VRPVAEGFGVVARRVGVVVGRGFAVVVARVVAGLVVVVVGDVALVVPSGVVGPAVVVRDVRSVAWAHPVTRTRTSPSQSVRRIRRR